MTYQLSLLSLLTHLNKTTFITSVYNKNFSCTNIEGITQLERKIFS